MKNRSQTFTGLKTVIGEYKQANGSVNVVTNYSFEPKFADNLSNVTTSKGDFKSPTVHRYQHDVRSAYIGLQYTKTISGNLWSSQTVTGPTGRYPDHRPLPLSLGSYAYNEALSDVNDQLRQQIDLSVDILDAGQVKGMLRGANKLYDHVNLFSTKYKGLRRLYEAYLRNPHSTLGKAWLTYAFGIAPIAKTVYDCAQNVINDTYQRLRVRGRATEHNYGKTVTPFDGGRSTRTEFWLESARCELVVQCALRDSALYSLANYTSLNPASVIWELTPYTWVSDYVFNIGGYLRNLETACLLATKFQGGYATYTYKTIKESFETSNYRDAAYEQYYDLRGRTELSDKNRTPLSSFPFPRPPTFRIDVGSRQVMHLASLIAVKLQR